MDELSLYEHVVIFQLQNLYTLFPDKESWLDGGENSLVCGHYHILFVFLEKEGHDFNFPVEEKKRLFSLARNKFTKEHQNWIKKFGKCEFNDRKLQEVYKSFLVRQYVCDNWHKGGHKLELTDSSGKPYKPIKLFAEKLKP